MLALFVMMVIWHKEYLEFVVPIRPHMRMEGHPLVKDFVLVTQEVDNKKNRLNFNIPFRFLGNPIPLYPSWYVGSRQRPPLPFASLATAKFIRLCDETGQCEGVSGWLWLVFSKKGSDSLRIVNQN